MGNTEARQKATGEYVDEDSGTSNLTPVVAPEAANQLSNATIAVAEITVILATDPQILRQTV